MPSLQDTLTLIMELLEGGELFDRIISLGAPARRATRTA